MKLTGVGDVFIENDVHDAYLAFSTEFTSIAKWVANSDVDPHMVEVVYALLDEDGDRNLSVKEFSPVLFQWRRSRGFQHQNLQISMGQLQI